MLCICFDDHAARLRGESLQCWFRTKLGVVELHIMVCHQYLLFLCRVQDEACGIAKLKECVAR